MKRADGRRKIETFALGQRVSTPGTNDGGGPTTIDPARTRTIALQAANPDGGPGSLEIELLRSVEWLEARGCRVGSTISLAPSDGGAKGSARVLAVGPSPEIEDGPGRVVTGRFTHLNGHLLELKLSSLDAPVEPTEKHSFYSEDRGGWFRPTRSGAARS